MTDSALPEPLQTLALPDEALLLEAPAAGTSPRELAVLALQQAMAERRLQLPLGPQLELANPERLLNLNRFAVQLVCGGLMADQLAVPLAPWAEASTAPQLLLAALIDAEEAVVHFAGTLTASEVQQAALSTADGLWLPLASLKGGVDRLFTLVQLLDPEALPRLAIQPPEPEAIAVFRRKTVQALDWFSGQVDPAIQDIDLATRPLHFIYLCDCSGSMAAQGKMQALNQAIRQSLPGMTAVARENPEARVLVRVVSFADQANWHIPVPTPVDSLEWIDLQAGGCTAMGEALQLVAEQLHTPPMEERALPPVLVLISDGQPTDDFEGGLARLMLEPWAQKAMRLAIALGRDADLEVLQQFIGTAPANQRERSPRRPLQASNATSLAQYIQWASTAVVEAASMPTSRLGDLLDRGIIQLPDLLGTEMYPIDSVEREVW